MSKSGRANKGQTVIFRSDSTRGLLSGQSYTMVRSFIRSGERWYKVQDRIGNVYDAPDIFFDFAKSKKVN